MELKGKRLSIEEVENVLRKLNINPLETNLFELTTFAIGKLITNKEILLGEALNSLGIYFLENEEKIFINSETIDAISQARNINFQALEEAILTLFIQNIRNEIVFDYEDLDDRLILKSDSLTYIFELDKLKFIDAVNFHNKVFNQYHLFNLSQVSSEYLPKIIKKITIKKEEKEIVLLYEERSFLDLFKGDIQNFYYLVGLFAINNYNNDSKKKILFSIESQ